MPKDHSGESYKRNEYPEIIREDILDKYKNKNVDPKVIENEIALETYAVRAALFLLDGPENHMKFVKDPEAAKGKKEAKKKDDNLIRIDDILEEDNKSFEDENLFEPKISYDRVKEVADELKKKGILTAAEQEYGHLLRDERKRKSEPVKIVPQEEMTYEGFLYKTIDKLPEFENVNADFRKNEAKNTMLKRGMTYREYWDYKCPDRGMDPGTPYRNESVSTYEYEAPESSWRLFTSMAHVLKGDAGKQMSRDELDRVKELPFPKLALRNKRTEEKLNRGDKEGTVNTQKSFTFHSDEELKQMQERAEELENEMRKMSIKAANSQEWRDLRFAMQKFSKAATKEEAAKHSAEVLLAVEKFTKGRKSKQDAETQPCVDKALESLAVCVPDASNNPSVKPLVDRFNVVRGWHLFQDSITLQNYGTTSELTAEKKPQGKINADPGKEAEEPEEELDPLNTAVGYGHKSVKEKNLFT